MKKAKKAAPKAPSALTIADLRMDPRNARKRTARNSAMIQESLQEVGAARSIVIDEDGRILAGNGTVEAAGQVGIERLKIVEADGNEIVAVRRRGLTETQKKRLALYDNRTAELAEWDADVLAGMKADGFEFEKIFEGEELNAILGKASLVLEDAFPPEGKLVTCPKCGHEFEA